MKLLEILSFFKSLAEVTNHSLCHSFFSENKSYFYIHVMNGKDGEIKGQNKRYISSVVEASPEPKPGKSIVLAGTLDRTVVRVSDN